MRSKYLQNVLDKTPKHISELMQSYGNIINVVYETLENNGFDDEEIKLFLESVDFNDKLLEFLKFKHINQLK